MLIFDAVGILLAVVVIVDRIGIGETLKDLTLSLWDFDIVEIRCADDRPAAAGGCVVAFLDQRVVLLLRWRSWRHWLRCSDNASAAGLNVFSRHCVVTGKCTFHLIWLEGSKCFDRSWKAAALASSVFGTVDWCLKGVVTTVEHWVFGSRKWRVALTWHGRSFYCESQRYRCKEMRTGLPDGRHLGMGVPLFK